jgi:hypothetical protein
MKVHEKMNEPNNAIWVSILIMLVVTVAAKLSFTINYLEETTDTETMEKIKTEALRYLD